MCQSTCAHISIAVVVFLQCLVPCDGKDFTSIKTCDEEQPFYSFLDFVQDNLGEPVPEETFTFSDLS